MNPYQSARVSGPTRPVNSNLTFYFSLFILSMNPLSTYLCSFKLGELTFLIFAAHVLAVPVLLFYFRERFGDPRKTKGIVMLAVAMAIPLFFLSLLFGSILLCLDFLGIVNLRQNAFIAPVGFLLFGAAIHALLVTLCLQLVCLFMRITRLVSF
jgi:hypothetical protein